MALVGVEHQTLVSEPDALTARFIKLYESFGATVKKCLCAVFNASETKLLTVLLFFRCCKKQFNHCQMLQTRLGERTDKWFVTGRDRDRYRRKGALKNNWINSLQTNNDLLQSLVSQCSFYVERC